MGRECGLHEVCGSSLAEGHLIRFCRTTFIGRKGREEPAVEVFLDLRHHRWVCDGAPPLPLLQLRMCKIGWFSRGESMNDIARIDEKIEVVHKVLINHDNGEMRRLSRLKNGTAIVFLLDAMVRVVQDPSCATGAAAGAVGAKRQKPRDDDKGDETIIN